jgi:hypothetical protein
MKSINYDKEIFYEYFIKIIDIDSNNLSNLCNLSQTSEQFGLGDQFLKLDNHFQDQDQEEKIIPELNEILYEIIKEEHILLKIFNYFCK